MVLLAATALGMSMVGIGYVLGRLDVPRALTPVHCRTCTCFKPATRVVINSRHDGLLRRVVRMDGRS